MKQYPIYVEAPVHEGEAWGISVPAIDGCFGAADREEDILVNAREAILLSLEALDTDEIQSPPGLAQARAMIEDYEGCQLLLVDVDTSALEGPSKRVNVSFREGLLNQIDAAARASNENRSEFLANSARLRISA